MTETQMTEPKPFTGRKMLLLIVSFFAVVIAANATMATFSGLTWTGLVVENTYVESNAFKQKQKAWRSEVAAGWQSRLAYTGNQLTFGVKDGAGNAVALKNVTVHLNRPIGTHGDRILTLKPQEDGSYAVPQTLDPGGWVAVITADDTSFGPFEAHKRLLIPEAR